jgi:hypothetical protein
MLNLAWERDENDSKGLSFPTSSCHKNLLSQSRQDQNKIKKEQMILTPALVSSLFVVQYTRKTGNNKLCKAWSSDDAFRLMGKLHCNAAPGTPTIRGGQQNDNQ